MNDNLEKSQIILSQKNLVLFFYSHAYMVPKLCWQVGFNLLAFIFLRNLFVKYIFESNKRKSQFLGIHY